MIITGILMGVAGSLHCVGMCSPLAMAVTNMSAGAFFKRIVYNAGRLMMYGVMGAVAGSVGSLFSGLSQNILSVAFGVLLLIVGMTGISRLQWIPFTGLLLKVNGCLKKMFATFIQRKNHTATFIMGGLNGLLPCGLTFMAVSYCMILPNASSGFVFMVSFGMGTLPVMLGLTSFLPWLVKRLKLNYSTIATGMLVVSGILLIARVFIVHTPHIPSTGIDLVDIVICR